MIIFCIRKQVFILLLFFSSCGFSQERFLSYWEPEFEISYDIAPLYSHKFSLEKRSLMYEKELLFDVVQFDFSHFSEFKLLDNQTVALGLMYRTRSPFGEERDELRLTEQYSLTSTTMNFRLGHRFRMEHRFSGKPVVHRLRYRLAVDFPIQGTRLDVGESFFTGSWENLLSLANTERPVYEQRFTVSLGYLANKKLTLMSGLEYRLDDYTHATKHVIFVLTSASISL
tara:strand:+ start:14536 stop:15219 length:684 start_codon:yes stop_codon:yes gene_type:complete